jgi:glycosyltransferase involved in cell wall biosynthesis
MEAIADGRGHAFRFVCSPMTAETLPQPLDTRFLVVSPSPARALAGRRSREKLLAVEKEFKPDVILSLFGPTYWKPRGIHVCGFANSWVYTRNSHANQLIRWYAWPARMLRWRLADCGLSRAHGFAVETEMIAEALRKRFPHKPVVVIPNSCGQSFLSRGKQGVENRNILPEKKQGEFRIVTLSRPYPHKKLGMVPTVGMHLRKGMPETRIRFFLSLDPKGKVWSRIARQADILGVREMVKTVGEVPPENAPAFYENADAMFLPTVLESFSATYAEAMAMGVPIVTTDLPFARAICRSSALYFKANDPAAAAECLKRLFASRPLRERLSAEGRALLNRLPSPRERLEAYITFCERVRTSYSTEARWHVRT